MVSMSPYSTLLDLSATSDLQGDDSASSSIIRSQSLHGYQLPGNSNASGDYTNVSHLGPGGSLEDFQRFKNGYECTSSQFGSLERPQKNELHIHKSQLSGSRSSLFNEIEAAMNSANFENQNGELHESDANDTFINVEENEDPDCMYLNINVEILPSEQRFGFSVMGGSDEDVSPRIDNISKGSPAERANLQVGDEIMEVNGKSLSEASHAEVIAYIHKCIRSKAISLRVKRKKDQVNITPEEVQSAYIVAVEEDAKRRLEELLYNHKLTAIDMTKNVGDSYSSTEEKVNNSKDSSLDRSILKDSSMSFMNQQNHLTNGHVEMSEMNGFREKEPQKKGKGKKGKQTGNSDTPLINNLLTERMLNNSQNSLNKSNMDDSLDDSYVLSSIEYDDGPHREMAIDVPSNFQGSVKTPPRFPSNHSSPRSTPFKNESAKNSKQNSNAPQSEEQMERIRRHQEEIRKRNERDELKAKEEKFLRESLRRSNKMRALQSEKKQAGIDNTGFEANDDDSGGFEEGYVSGRHTQNSRDYMKKNISYEDILASLQHIRGKVTSQDGKEKLKFLANFFNHRHFQNAVNIHHNVLDIKTRSPPVKSICVNSQEITQDSVEELCSIPNGQASELVSILNKPNVKCLLFAHDEVAKVDLQSSQNHQPPDDDFNMQSVQDGGANIKIVHLDKTTEPLGATVRNDGESVIISRIVKGGTAEKSGLLHEGDEILDINGIDMKGKDINEVSDMLVSKDPGTGGREEWFTSQGGEILDINGIEMKGKDINEVSDMLADMTGRITFTIYANTEHAMSSTNTGIKHVKALFNYDPEEDMFIPCRELGVSFMKGDILHVINQADNNWWQAYREGEEDYQTLAGLIPSKAFHEQRESLRVTVVENKENQKKSRSCTCGRSNKKKKKRNAYKQQEDSEEILSYEEVIQYYPEPNRRRPIVLIGPPNVGRHELRQRLMESDFDRFAAAVPHTSRPMKVPGPGEEPEINGKDYHFVSRPAFEADIMANKFIESGEFEKNLYGTSVEAVKQVINLGKICVLNTDPEALYILHHTDLKPYVIFICPPNIEKLRQIQQRLGVSNIIDDGLRDIIERGREMEDRFGHFFDCIIVNSDMEKAFTELMNEINRIEVEPQWIPAIWMT